MRWVLATFILLSFTLAKAENIMNLPFTDLGRHERRFPYDNNLPPTANIQVDKRLKAGEELWIDPDVLPKNALADGNYGLLVLEGGKEGPLTLRSIERGKKLIFRVEKAEPKAKPLHAVLLRMDLLDRTAEFFIGRQRLDIVFSAEYPLGPGPINFVPLIDKEATSAFAKQEKALYLIPTPRPGTMVFDERIYALVVLSDPAFRLYGIEQWDRWVTTDKRQSYIVIHVFKPWDNDVALAYPSAALVPATLLSIPNWEVRTGIENEVRSYDTADALLVPGGKLLQLPVRRHDGLALLVGTPIPFNIAPKTWADHVPSVKQIRSTRFLKDYAAKGGDVSVYEKMDFANHDLVAISLGQAGSTGYAVQVQKILRTDETVEFHLLAINPGPMQMTGQAITYPSCAVWVKKADVKGKWRFYMNGRLWDASITIVE